MPAEFVTCSQCGCPVPFVDGVSDEEKHAEAVHLWGKRGDAPGMVIVCEDCFLGILASIKLTKGES